MVHSITVDNVNTALSELLFTMRASGVVEDSRNGIVTRLNEPVVLTYKRPWERVQFGATRDANPFFHHMESIWMLAGHNDLRFVEMFNKRMAEFSDNGVTLNGAYGYRWREYWDFDQIESLIQHLTENPNSRRGVLGMWCPRDLLNVAATKDTPCNLVITFQNQSDALIMTVFNRSNDIVWGMTGANAVHMSMLHEYMARALNLVQGEYRQITVNAHIYHTEQGQELMDNLASVSDDRYTYGRIGWLPLFQDPSHRKMFDNDSLMFLSDPTGDNTYQTYYFEHVVMPMMNTWCAHKADDREYALEAVEQIMAPDWCAACSEWLRRRYDRI